MKPGKGDRARGWIARAVFLAVVLAFGRSSQGQTVRNLTSLPAEYVGLSSQAALDDAGSVVYAVSSSNQFGTNPRYSWQIFRWDPASGAGAQVTSFEKGVDSTPFGYYRELVSVSDDGQWLAFVSCSDLVGLNHDGSTELYVMRADGSGIVQLTNDPAFDAGTVYTATIAGSGNRVVFLADVDPLWTNSGRHQQVFIVNRDGTGLRQLTNALTDVDSFISTSDDGSRIVFDHREDLAGENPGGLSQVFAIDADGTGLRQLSHVTSGYALGPVLSGDGTTVAFRAGGNRVWKVDWAGTGSVDLASGRHPSITDDGQTIVYEGPYQSNIWKIGADGTGNTQLTSGVVPGNQLAAISGDGSRVVFQSHGGEYPGGDNPDGGTELMAMDSAGGNLNQLTRLTVAGYGFDPVITADGTRTFFVSAGNIFRIQADGTGLAQVTAFTDRTAWSPSASPDGSVVVFRTDGSRDDIFKINADGTGLTQLTTQLQSWLVFSPVISADGQWVVFESNLPAGTNINGSREVFRVRSDATQLWSVTADDDPEYFNYKRPRMSDSSPAWIVYQSASNIDGQNPDGSMEILRTRITGTPVQRITADAVYDSIDPDISGNSNLVVYASEADPLATNPDHNREVFLYDAPTATRRQLTFTTSGASDRPRISRNGAWVSFRSSAPFFEPNPDGHYEPYRVSVATGIVERLGGTRCCGASLRSPEYDDTIAIDSSGLRSVFIGLGDWADQNPDRREDIYIVDQAARPMIRIGKEAPTLVSWDSEPKPLRYDVIRGDMASVRAGASGTVDLGPVVCIEDDSPDTYTAGFEDPVQPPSGHAFFYLYRGTQGLFDGPGSWGQGSAGAERIAGAGACSP